MATNLLQTHETVLTGGTGEYRRLLLPCPTEGVFPASADHRQLRDQLAPLAAQHRTAARRRAMLRLSAGNLV
jgi:hypothetical protein